MACVNFENNVLWLHDGQEVVCSDKVLIFDFFLVITDVDIDSGGLYSCYRAMFQEEMLFLRAIRLIVECELH